MNILFIAPIPPPINGQSLYAEVLLERLKGKAKVDIVNMAKSSHIDGLTSLTRIIEVLRFFIKIKQLNRRADVIYLHISESIFGNLKDLVIYFLCRKNINKFIIHLHGGSFEKQVLSNNYLLRLLNSFYIKKMKGVIVLGKSHVEIFSSIVPLSRISIVPNFSLDDYFVTRKEIDEKSKKSEILKILYLSNMIPKKGYMKLLQAFFLLDDSYRTKIQIDFAGRFNSFSNQEDFLNNIQDFLNLKYHGIVNGKQKERLLKEAHIFVLPTSYNEGQPISILEAYASGCIVLVTQMGGIPDIFSNRINGLYLESDSPFEIANKLIYIIDNFYELGGISKTNNKSAKSFFTKGKNIDLLIKLLLNKK